MTEDERRNAPQEEPGGAPEEPGAAPEDQAQGDPSAHPGESPAAGDEDLSTTEDEAEEVTEAPESEEPAAEAEAPEGEEPAAESEAEAPAEAPPERRPKPPEGKKEPKKDEVIPGEHLAPDLVLEEERPEGEFGEFGDSSRFGPGAAEAEAPVAEGGAPAAGAPEAPAEGEEPRSVVELAADARYQATGKRKTSVARVILRPGDGAYRINGRSLDEYFPRAALQKAAREPLTTAGFDKRMDVVARIHGGGVSSQAGALRHGVARALVEADPALRVELKRRGFLSRDARAKERKKAGLKKARKRPQFSKR